MLVNLALKKLLIKFIRGIDGSFDEEVDVAGNVVKQLGQRDPIPGKSLQLTIDKEFAEVMEKLLMSNWHICGPAGLPLTPEQRLLLRLIRAAVR